MSLQWRIGLTTELLARLSKRVEENAECLKRLEAGQKNLETAVATICENQAFLNSSVQEISLKLDYLLGTVEAEDQSA